MSSLYLPSYLSAERKSREIDRIVAVQNPTKDRDRFSVAVEQLESTSGLGVVAVDTEKDPFDTHEKLMSVLEENGGVGQDNSLDLVYCHGGDGTLNSTLEALLEYKALLLSSRAGTANDFDVAMNGGRYNRSRYTPADILDAAMNDQIAPVQIKLIEMIVNEKIIEGSTDGTPFNSRLLAANYASFGFTALASTGLNGRELRGLEGLKKDRAEAQTVLNTAKDAKPMAIRFKGNDAEYDSTTMDLAFIHSSRMAKRLRPGVSQIDDELMMYEMQKRDAATLSRTRVLWNFALLAAGIAPGAELFSGESKSFRLEGMKYDGDVSDIYAMTDGEDYKFCSPIEAEVRLTDGTVPVLSMVHGRR